MDHKKELARIESNNALDSMPAVPWVFRVRLGADGERVIARLLEVMSLIARHSNGEWPSDDQWRGLMPAWLREKMPELTKEQTDKLLAATPQDQWDSLPWDFLSWLDAVHDRGWLWWGYNHLDSEAVIVVHIGMLPERIDAFRELLRSSGMEIVSENYAGLNA